MHPWEVEVLKAETPMTAAPRRLSQRLEVFNVATMIVVRSMGCCTECESAVIVVCRENKTSSRVGTNPAGGENRAHCKEGWAAGQKLVYALLQCTLSDHRACDARLQIGKFANAIVPSFFVQKLSALPVRATHICDISCLLPLRTIFFV